MSVGGRVVGRCGVGLLCYVGVMAGDREADADWLAGKLTALRIFPDDQGRMNRSVAEVGGGLLLISNFTLAGRAKKGARPSFTDAAPPDAARPLFERVAARCAAVVPTETGRFGAPMQIESVADGPITVIVSSTE